MSEASSLHQYGLTPEQMLGDLERFGGRVMDLLTLSGLDLRFFSLDHIALRINSAELAEQAHHAWRKRGTEISSALINGRPIIVIQLEQSITCGHWSVDCLELPYPAAGKVYPNQGWEHVEFVVHSEAQTEEDYLEDVKIQFPELKSRWERLSTMGIQTKLSCPKGEGERLLNPTVAFKKEDVCIKLHRHSLQAVIASEKQ